MAEIEDVWNANKDDFHTEREWFELGVMARDDEIREKDKEIERLKAGATLTMYREVVDEADKWRDLADELGEQIRERDSRIATLEKVVEAARTICDATYLHEMINAATDIRKALKELEGV